MAAARAGDTTAHGGTIGPVTTGVAAQVFIGSKPAACLGDPHVCPMFSGPKPHTGGTITKGSATVLIGGKPAARVADLTVCTAEPGQVATGEMTVLIGDLAAPGPIGVSGDASDGAVGAEAAADPLDAERPEAEESFAETEWVQRRPGDSEQALGAGRHWISIELVDEAEQPVVGERYRLRLPDGREVRGALDVRGQARITGLKDPGSCEIAFPELDSAAWHRWTGANTSTAAPSPSASGVGGLDAPVARGPASRTGQWRTAARGECISSMAAESGHFWQTIWDHAANAGLKRARGNPNVLRAGDAVFVPAARPKSDVGAIDQHHKFVRRGEPAQLRLRIRADDEPRAEVPWVLEVDGNRFEGFTDADGNLAVPMPGGARRALLRVGPPEDVDEYELDLGTVQPVHSPLGVRARLENLGFLKPAAAVSDSALADAVRAFQQRNGLGATGTMDEATRARLLEEHGS
jgi:N-acetylmuramoyl-L-alanine amidase